MRELALAFIARRSPRGTSRLRKLHSRLLIANDNPTRIVILSDQRESKDLSLRSPLLKPLPPNLLIANPELEFLPSHTKRGSLRFPNRKKIAVFDPHFNDPSQSPELSSPLARPNNCCIHRRAIYQHIPNRNSRFTEFRSTYCKHTPYQIPNRNKNARLAFYTSQIASQGSGTANHESRTTTRAAFRSTIPARPHAYR